jgi:hypothetical protein
MIGDYAELIKQFLDKGYKDIFFNELTKKDNQLIIRHDIDYDCELAFKIAKIEKVIGVKSTFFFMLSNPIYNVFSEKNKIYINDIKSLGHEISIHFDCEVGDLKNEIEIFESFFDTKINIISIHRPNLDILHKLNVEHTYLPKYFDDIKYLSDSRGEFGYGHPIHTEEFKKGRSIQLLIHPVWWTYKKLNTIEIIEDLINKNNKMNKEFFKQNFSPYKEYIK